MNSNKVEEVGWIIGGQTVVGNRCEFVPDTKVKRCREMCSGL